MNDVLSGEEILKTVREVLSVAGELPEARLYAAWKLIDVHCNFSAQEKSPIEIEASLFDKEARKFIQDRTNTENPRTIIGINGNPLKVDATYTLAEAAALARLGFVPKNTLDD